MEERDNCVCVSHQKKKKHTYACVRAHAHAHAHSHINTLCGFPTLSLIHTHTCWKIKNESLWRSSTNELTPTHTHTHIYTPTNNPPPPLPAHWFHTHTHYEQETWHHYGEAAPTSRRGLPFRRTTARIEPSRCPPTYVCMYVFICIHTYMYEYTCALRETTARIRPNKCAPMCVCMYWYLKNTYMNIHM